MNDVKSLMKAAEAPESDDGPRTLVHEIVQSKLPPPEKSFKRVFEEVSTTTGAGFETTAAVLRIAGFHIYSNPDILQRLRTELSSAPTLDWETLEQFPFLTAIVQESMRLAPALATRSARVAQDKDLVHAGWRIPAGTPIGMTIHLLHQNEDDYPDPLHFDPDRWMNPNSWQTGSRTFIPFGKGKRNCVGMQ